MKMKMQMLHQGIRRRDSVVPELVGFYFLKGEYIHKASVEEGSMNFIWIICVSAFLCSTNACKICWNILQSILLIKLCFFALKWCLLLLVQFRSRTGGIVSSLFDHQLHHFDCMRILMNYFNCLISIEVIVLSNYFLRQKYTSGSPIFSRKKWSVTQQKILF